MSITYTKTQEVQWHTCVIDKINRSDKMTVVYKKI